MVQYGHNDKDNKEYKTILNNGSAFGYNKVVLWISQERSLLCILYKRHIAPIVERRSKNSMGAIICLYDKKLYLRENLVAFTVEYV